MEKGEGRRESRDQQAIVLPTNVVSKKQAKTQSGSQEEAGEGRSGQLGRRNNIRGFGNRESSRESRQV